MTAAAASAVALDLVCSLLAAIQHENKLLLELSTTVFCAFYDPSRWNGGANALIELVMLIMVGGGTASKCRRFSL